LAGDEFGLGADSGHSLHGVDGRACVRNEVHSDWDVVAEYSLHELHDLVYVVGMASSEVAKAQVHGWVLEVVVDDLGNSDWERDTVGEGYTAAVGLNTLNQVSSSVAEQRHQIVVSVLA
jgi:hypothetical protein